MAGRRRRTQTTTGGRPQTGGVNAEPGSGGGQGGQNQGGRGNGGQGNGGGGNGHGGNGGGGRGGNGGRGGHGGGNGGNRRNGPYADVSDLVRNAVRGAARLAYGDQMSDLREQLDDARGHGRAIDRAYDAYANQLQGLGAAQDQATAATQASILSGTQALQGIQGEVTDANSMAAMQRAKVLGQGSTVADTIDQAGAGSAAALGADGSAMLSGVANVGLANYTDFARRGGIAENDRIRAEGANYEAIQDLRRERRDLKGERGAYIAQQLLEQQQQEIENQLAFAGLRLDRRDQRHDNRLDDQNYQLELADTIFDNNLAAQSERHDTQNDRRDDRRGGRGGSGNGGGGGGGMSPSERQDFNDAKEGVNSVWNRLEKVLRNHPGMDIQEAARRAGSRSGAEGWEVALAKDLAKDGSLSRAGRQEWRSHIPGKKVPKKWRR